MPALLDDTILIRAECQKLGRTLAFSVGDIFLESNQKLVASGKHVKAVLNRSFFD
jgi:acyl-coenzyme A thioesterase 13